MKGTKEKADIGDDDYPLCLDTKLRKNWNLRQWLMELEDHTREEGKGRIPVLVVRKPYAHITYSISPLQWLTDQIDAAGHVTMFLRDQYSGTRWDLEKRFLRLRRYATGINKIPLLLLGDTKSGWYGIVERHVLASLLKVTGFFEQEDHNGQ